MTRQDTGVRVIGVALSVAIAVLGCVLAKAAIDTLYIEPTDDALRAAHHGRHLLRVWSGVVIGCSVTLALVSGRAWTLLMGGYGLLALFATAGSARQSSPLAVLVALGGGVSALLALVAAVVIGIGPVRAAA